MNSIKTEPRRTRVATETSASDGWIARLSAALPIEPKVLPRHTNLPLRPPAVKTPPAKP